MTRANIIFQTPQGPIMRPVQDCRCVETARMLADDLACTEAEIMPVAKGADYDTPSPNNEMARDV